MIFDEFQGGNLRSLILSSSNDELLNELVKSLKCFFKKHNKLLLIVRRPFWTFYESQIMIYKFIFTNFTLKLFSFESVSYY